MPQDVEFLMPFPHRISPDLGRAQACGLQWLRGRHLIRSARAERHFLRWRTADLGGCTYPDASGPALDLAVDLMGWYFLFDDQFDADVETASARAVSACAELERALDDPERAVAEGLSDAAAAFADIWSRAREGTSAAWQARAAENWRDYFFAHVEEAAVRRRGRVPDVDDYLELRRSSISMLPALDLAEALGGFEVPQRVARTSWFRVLRRLPTDHVVLVHDVFSVEKEEKRGDPFDLVLLLERGHGHSREQAVDAVRAMADERMKRFLAVRAELPGHCAGLDLTEREFDAVRRAVEAMGYWMRGNLDWHRASGRYDTRNVLPETSEQGYLEDLLVAGEESELSGRLP